MTPLSIVVQALTKVLDVPVSTIMPTGRPPQHVIVTRIGSSESTFGTSISRFLVECFAPSPLEAEALGEEVHAAWLSSRGGAIHWVDSDHNLAPYDPPSPGDAGATGEAGVRRYQFTGSVQFLDRAFDVLKPERG
ncbi:hypothetical protein [Corynebacterium stationis]|uniref:hypothetical protein n=1 Tax=Corynebacterium stationis TaxID=1705 RepID=UPI0028A9D74F|nr:hypothetical protein [Corynebacterium stationis]